MAKRSRPILGDDPFETAKQPGRHGEDAAQKPGKPAAEKKAKAKAKTIAKPGKRAATTTDEKPAPTVEKRPVPKAAKRVEKKPAEKKPADKKRAEKKPADKTPAKRSAGAKGSTAQVAEAEVPPGLAAALAAEIAEAGAREPLRDATGEAVVEATDAPVATPVVEVGAGHVAIPPGDLVSDEEAAAKGTVAVVDTRAQPIAKGAGEASRQPKISTPPPPPVETASEYGPSIDRPTALGLRGRAVEAVRHIEERLRSMLLSHPSEESRRTPPLELVWKRRRALAMRERSDVVDEFGRDPNVAAALDPMLDFLYESWFRVTTTGVENVPATGRALIVANHSGSLPYDGGMIMHAIRREHSSGREVRPLVEDFVFHFPYLGTLVNRIGGVRACQENAERLLQTDQLVAVFPEGEKGIGKLFSQRYQLQRFGRGGFIKLALASDAPIIPAAVVGAEEIHPMLAKVTWLSKALGIPYLPITPTFPWLGPIGLLPLPAKWYIAFGRPLDFAAEYGREAAHDRILVNKLAEQVRQRIQEMIDELVKSRRSVLFG